MSREGKLLKNTAIITIGKISTQMISFFLLPLYTSLLSTSDYGVVELLNTLVSLCVPILTLQIDQAIFRYLVDNRGKEENTKKGITTSIESVTVVSIIYLIIFAIISPLVNNSYKYFLATNVIANIYSSLFLQISRGLGDNKTYAEGSFVTAALSVILNVLFIAKYSWGASGMLTASLIGNIACTIYIFFRKRIFKYIEVKIFSKNLLKKLLKYSVPLIPNAIAWWIFNSSDRIIVSAVLGVGQTGILSAAYKFSNVYITLYNIFNMTWTESAALHIADEDNVDYFSRVINVMFNLFSSICIGIIAFMPFIFKVMINEKFGVAYNQIPILMMSSLFNVVVGLLSVIYIAKKDTKAVAKTSAMAAIINIVVNLGLIKFVGLYAASISTIVAYGIMAINRYFDVRNKYLKVKIEPRNLIMVTIALVIVNVCYYSNSLILKATSATFSLVFAWFANYKSLKTIKKIIIGKFKGIKNGK